MRAGILLDAPDFPPFLRLGTAALPSSQRLDATPFSVQRSLFSVGCLPCYSHGGSYRKNGKSWSARKFKHLRVQKKSGNGTEISVEISNFCAAFDGQKGARKSISDEKWPASLGCRMAS